MAGLETILKTALPLGGTLLGLTLSDGSVEKGNIIVNEVVTYLTYATLFGIGGYASAKLIIYDLKHGGSDFRRPRP